jgi:hypothetical protein
MRELLIPNELEQKGSDAGTPVARILACKSKKKRLKAHLISPHHTLDS